MNYIRNGALIIVEVNEPNKAPELKHITLGTSDVLKSDEAFGRGAKAYLEASKEHPPQTVYKIKSVNRFNTLDDYLKYLGNQLED